MDNELGDPNARVCYCFGYSVWDIEEDIVVHGRSGVIERIVAAKASGGCQCARENPRGR